MTQKLIAHRAHPRYQSLAQEIYDCGHTRSVKPQELGEINKTTTRCVKCIKGMPVEISRSELQKLKGKDLSKMLIIERLYQCLDYHLMVTEKSRGSLDGNLEAIDSAIHDAHAVLRDAGFLIETSLDSKVESSIDLSETLTNHSIK
ncbi:MAG: hypothetical protein ACC653_08150 [Gammaproteobacteria bacterium]